MTEMYSPPPPASSRAQSVSVVGFWRGPTCWVLQIATVSLWLQVVEGTGALSQISFIRTLILCHLLSDYFYKIKTRSSALPLSGHHSSIQRAETLWRQLGKKKNESPYGIRLMRWGSLPRAGSKRPLSWHLVQLYKGPGGCQWLKALWALPWWNPSWTPELFF